MMIAKTTIRTLYMQSTVNMMCVCVMTACGSSSEKTFSVAASMDEAQSADVRGAVDVFNGLFDCEIIHLVEQELVPVTGDGISQIIFSDLIGQDLAGWTSVEGGARGGGEVDVLIRPKPSKVEIAGRAYHQRPEYVSTILHELGHAYGLQHVDRLDDIMYTGGDPSFKSDGALARYKEQLEAVGVGCTHDRRLREDPATLGER